MAVITPPGQGGVAALRIAGPDSYRLLTEIFRPSSSSEPTPFLLRHGHVVSFSGEKIDEVLAVFMPCGNSYTGLDQVEIFCHGGAAVVRTILSEVTKHGARPAEPGEFTRLAFLNGRIDLARAEAVAEMIAAATEVSLAAGREHLLGAYSEQVDRIRGGLLAGLAEIEASIDFAENETDLARPTRAVGSDLAKLNREIRFLAATYKGGRMIREGFRIAICGRSNAGKSSLFNLLLRQQRALVDPQAGTTRDYLSEWIEMDGFAVNIIDTAGFRDQAEPVEQRGQERAREQIDRADLLLWLADLTEPNWQTKADADLVSLGNVDKVFVCNKIDLVSNNQKSLPERAVAISCVDETGFDQLKARILSVIRSGMPDLTSGQVVTSARHHDCLNRAAEAIDRAESAIADLESPEIIAFELRSAADALGEITGQFYNEQILGEIFSKFCIGK